jgi:hypothetical protein
MQQRIPAAWMRGGTSKGIFFRAGVLPDDRAARDRLILRLLGSPDPYAKQIDGLGGATSSTSKAVIVGPSSRDDCDVDYLFAHAAIDRALVDWSGNCGNLTAAVGPFAIEEGLVAAVEPITTVRIWQANTGKRIIARVPVKDGQPVVSGDLRLPGLPFAGAPVELEFLEPGGSDEAPLLPTGNLRDRLVVTGLGEFDVSLINAGNPCVCVDARALGLRGDESQAEVNGDADMLARIEAVRAEAAVLMGLATSAADASAHRPGTPKVALLAPPMDYRNTAGELIAASSVDLCARNVSMGLLHQAFTGTGLVAMAVAAALPGSLVHELAGGALPLRLGHAAGVTELSASVVLRDDGWHAESVSLQRSARRLMEGNVLLPADTF